MRSALHCNINAVTVSGKVTVVEIYTTATYTGYICAMRWHHNFACHTIALLQTCNHMTGWRLKIESWCAAELKAAH